MLRIRKRTIVNISCIILLGILLVDMSSVVIAANGGYQVALLKETEYFAVTQYDNSEWIKTVQRTWKLYDATYNFENDEIGEKPLGLLIREYGNCTARIEEEEDGHAQVLRFSDVDEYSVDMNYYFLENQTHGSVEFYIKYNNSGGSDKFYIEGNEVNFTTGKLNKRFSIVYEANVTGVKRWQYYIDGTYYSIPNITLLYDDDWHHMTIHFECGNNSYQGLEANQWEIILDNNSSGVLNFNGTAEYLNSFYIATNGSDTNYSYYIDALGFSWDDEYTVGDNINNWEIVSTLPSDWFEGESLNVGAQAKYMTRGWVDISWTMYDVIKSIFLQDDFLLLMAIEELGYNETEINNNYTDTFQLWYGLRVFWNFTIGEIEEEPSDTWSRIFIFQNPEDYKKILDDYNDLIGVLKNDTDIPEIIRDEFTNFTADEFIWQLVMSGLGTANPFDTYLTTLVNELGCENATVNENTLIMDRLGETKYSVEVTYGTLGTQTSFVVKNEDGITIFEVTSTGNTILVFYVILAIMAVGLVALVSFILIRKRKISR